jgi:hypothetical protein
LSRFEINPNTMEPYVQEPRRMPEQLKAASPVGNVEDLTRKPPSPSGAPLARTTADPQLFRGNVTLNVVPASDDST